MAPVTKLVKVDNWGEFFLQRLKSFFNRTDYCDLTLQFRDFAQLKVHRLVLSACTKYFELLERSCEMYDDCLIMPDDLQADVVVPIVNFMYTGQLEYDYELYDRLYSTAQIMNMTVLTKLLHAQKASPPEAREPPSGKEAIIMNDRLADKARPSTSDDFTIFDKKNVTAGRKYGPGPGCREGVPKGHAGSDLDAARPTRYELPEGLDNDDLFEPSFADISYESLPIMKPNKRRNSNEPSGSIYDEGSSSRKFDELRKIMGYKRQRLSSESSPKEMDPDRVDEIVYREKMRSDRVVRENLSDDDNEDSFGNLLDYRKPTDRVREKENSGIVFEGLNKYNQSQRESFHGKSEEKNSNISINHAKIISEVLKKYPHLVKSEKNIKLKIVTGKETNSTQSYILEPNKRDFSSISNSSQRMNSKEDGPKPDWIYVPRNVNAETMANLVALGAENTTGPWLCLICGTPTKALKFLTYNKFYRHLVDQHKERIPPKICEYCGFKSGKRNHLLHHMYTKHDIPPPPHYHFPKCNFCSYIALTEAFLVKHKLTHVDSKDFTCSGCNSTYKTRAQLLYHIHTSGHKVTPDRKISTKCVYCNKVFLREANLYTHLKVAHKEVAKSDGIIENSDDDYEDNKYVQNITSYDYAEPQEEHVEIKEEFDGKIQIISNTQLNKPYAKSPQKLLNANFIGKIREKIKEYEPPTKQYQKVDQTHTIDIAEQNPKVDTMGGNISRNIANNINLVDVVVLNENEYILQNEDDDITIDQPLKHDQISLEVPQGMILSNMPEQQSVDMSVQQNVRIPQIMSMNTIKTHKLNQPSQNIITAQNQPVQLLYGNQQYKAIVSSSPIIYSNTPKTAVLNDNNKFLPSQISNIQLGNTQEGDVMVLNEEDFQIACSQSLPTDGSNIVVVYSHPVQNNKEFVEVAEQQFENITSDNQEIETHMEQIHAEECEPKPSTPDHELVHETVETWQEETVIDSAHEIKENSMIENNTVAENVVCEDQSTAECVMEVEQDEATTEIEKENMEEVILQDDQVEASESPEIVISEQGDEYQEDVKDEEVIKCPKENDEDEQVDTTSMTVAECEDVKHEPEQEEEQEVSITANDCIETNGIHDYALQHKESEDVIAEEIQSKEVSDVATEWSEDTDSSKELKAELSDNGSSKILELEKSNLDQTVEVEESIENIQEEIKKQAQDHLLEKELSVESIRENPLAVELEDTKNEPETKETPSEDDKEVVLEYNSCSSHESNQEVNKIEKGKSIEKISHLLTEWEDNESQSDIIAPVENKENNVNLKDSHIEKLVSDWVDEDDEK